MSLCILNTGCPKSVIARSEATKQSRPYGEIATLPTVARNDRRSFWTACNVNYSSNLNIRHFLSLIKRTSTE